jgi:hypothetical protein
MIQDEMILSDGWLTWCSIDLYKREHTIPWVSQLQWLGCKATDCHSGQITAKFSEPVTLGVEHNRLLVQIWSDFTNIEHVNEMSAAW